MNNKELQVKVAERVGVSQKVAGEMLEAMVKVMTTEVKEDGTSAFFDLGILEVKTKEQRTMFNPNTGQMMLIPPKNVLGFKQYATVKNLIN